MHIETWEEVINKNTTPGLNGLTVRCSICGREFGCNKTYHVLQPWQEENGNIFAVFLVIKKDQIQREKMKGK